MQNSIFTGTLFIFIVGRGCGWSSPAL